MIRWIAASYNGRNYHAYDTNDIQFSTTRVAGHWVPDANSSEARRWELFEEVVPIPPSLVSFCKQANRLRLPLRPVSASKTFGWREIVDPDPMLVRNLCSRCFKRAMERGVFK